LWLFGRDSLVALGDLALKVDPLRLDAVAVRELRESLVGIYLEVDRQVGPKPFGDDVAEVADVGTVQSPAPALVGDARIGEPIADHGPAFIEGRPDHLVHQLRPCNAEQLK